MRANKVKRFLMCDPYEQPIHLLPLFVLHRLEEDRMWDILEDDEFYNEQPRAKRQRRS